MGTLLQSFLCSLQVSSRPKTAYLLNLSVTIEIFILGYQLYACGRNSSRASTLNKLPSFRMETG